MSGTLKLFLKACAAACATRSGPRSITTPVPGPMRRTSSRPCARTASSARSTSSRSIIPCMGPTGIGPSITRNFSRSTTTSAPKKRGSSTWACCSTRSSGCPATSSATSTCRRISAIGPTKRRLRATKTRCSTSWKNRGWRWSSTPASCTATTPTKKSSAISTPTGGCCARPRSAASGSRSAPTPTARATRPVLLRPFSACSTSSRSTKSFSRSEAASRASPCGT